MLILSKDLVMPLNPGGTTKRKEHSSAHPCPEPRVSRSRNGKFLWFQDKDKQELWPLCLGKMSYQECFLI